LGCVLVLCLVIIGVYVFRLFFFFFFQAEDGIRDRNVTGVQTCALPILLHFFKSFSYMSFNFISCYCITNFFTNGNTETEMVLRSFFFIVYDEFTICKGFTSPQYLLKFTIFFYTIFLFHSIT